MKYKVYKLTSPSGKYYIGYTSKNIRARIKQHKLDRNLLLRKRNTLPRFYAAWQKYPIKDWAIEVLFETDTRAIALEQEKLLIEFHNTRDERYGYNMAEGGNGGNTGRNGEQQKRQQHSAFIRKFWSEHYEVKREACTLAWRRIKDDSRRYFEICKIRSEATPRGVNHWNHSGLWVVRYNIYEIARNAAITEGIPQGTIEMYCNHPNNVFRRGAKWGVPGKTRRECGFYRIRETTNDHV